MKSDRAARLMAQLPPESRLLRVLQPSNNWSWNEVLLNKIVYFMEVLTWQKTKDAQKQNPVNQPKLFTPYFMKVEDQVKDLEAHTTEDVREILSRPRL